MPFAPSNREEKPYNTCIDCKHIGKNCDGPNFLAMEMTRLSEWCRLRKEYLHDSDQKWTNAFIAEKAAISKISVDRFLSGHVEDLKMSTAARIVRVLVNGSWGQYPCAMVEIADKETVYVDNPDLRDKISKLETQLEKQEAAHKEIIAEVRSDNQKKINFLKEQVAFKDKMFEEHNNFIRRKNWIIQILSSLLGIAVVIIIAALVIDGLNPNIGFFWLQ